MLHPWTTMRWLTTQGNYFGKIYRRKLLRPKSRDENSSDRSIWSVPNFLPLPSPSNKAGWAYHSKLLGDKRKQNNRTCCRLLSANSCESVKLLPLSETNWNNSNIEQHRCSMFELFQFLFILYNLESFSFARWRSVKLSVWHTSRGTAS